MVNLESFVFDMPSLQRVSSKFLFCCCINHRSYPASGYILQDSSRGAQPVVDPRVPTQPLVTAFALSESDLCRSACSLARYASSFLFHRKDAHVHARTHFQKDPLSPPCPGSPFGRNAANAPCLAQLPCSPSYTCG